MKYYEQLLRLEVFSLNDVAVMLDSKNNAKVLLQRYLNKGYIKKAKRNLYVCVSLGNRNSTANRFVIGSNINDSAYISHHSALEYYGFANQTFFEVFVASDKRFNQFEFEDITYRYVKSSINKGVVHAETNSKIRITDLERTIIDCIKNIDLAGGTEELFQCLDMVNTLNNDRLCEYLEEYNLQFMYQKAGFIFERYKSEYGIKDELLASCLEKVSDSIRYFDNDTKEDKGTYLKKWQLIVPRNIEGYFNQGVNELV